MNNFKEIFNELYNEFMKIEVVDIHQHLNPLHLAARSFEDIVFYHYIVTELASAGMSREDFEKAHSKEKLLKALPYFKYVRSTSTFWCLRQILKNIYGLDVKNIDEGNWKNVMEAIESKPRDNKWAYDILKNVCRVKKSFLTVNPLEPLPQYDRDVFTGALRVEHIVQNISKDSLIKTERAFSIEINDVNSLEAVIEVIFKKFNNDIVAITIPIQPDEIFRLSYNNEVSHYIKDLKRHGFLTDGQRMAIASFVFHKLVSLCGHYGKTVQLMLGVKRPVPMAAPPDYAITMYNPQQVLNLVNIFAMYPDVKFDIMTADSTLSHQLTVIAKNYSNVSLSGYWWYSMYPEIIRSYIRLRLQMLPHNKVGGFFSDAYVVEWVYGKAALAKKELAYVLAEMIYLGYIDKDIAIDIAKAVLHENTTRIYKL
jgi:glucuronate isomerase